MIPVTPGELYKCNATKSLPKKSFAPRIIGAVTYYLTSTRRGRSPCRLRSEQTRGMAPSPKSDEGCSSSCCWAHTTYTCMTDATANTASPSAGASAVSCNATATMQYELLQIAGLRHHQCLASQTGNYHCLLLGVSWFCRRWCARRRTCRPSTHSPSPPRQTCASRPSP